MPMEDSYLVRPIGVVQSPFETPSSVPIGGDRATLVVFPEFQDGLNGLEYSSHLVVIAFLHQADRSALATRPRKCDPTAPPRGIFGSRSPARPNPVSVTVVPILNRIGQHIEVDHLDLVNVLADEGLQLHESTKSLRVRICLAPFRGPAASRPSLC